MEHWFLQLLANVFMYTVLLFPGALVVYMVKRKSCPSKLQSSRIVKVFVYGVEDRLYASDVELERMMDGGEDDKEKNSSSKLSLNNLSNSRALLLLGYCFAGLQCSYLVWGVLQEKIMTTEYESGFASHSESHKIKFRDSQFLVLVNRVLALVFSALALIVINFRRKTPEAKRVRGAYVVAPLYEFVFCSLSNILSSWCQYEALKFVNFPTQVLSKACKIMPVMLMSQLVGGKKYKAHEYICALAISLGMTMFLLGNHQNLNSTAHHSVQDDSQYNLLDGLLVLALYLTFDSFTSNWQGKLFEKYKISTWQMMAAVNSYSIFLTSTSLAEQGELLPALSTVLSSFALTRDCILLSLFSAAGQLFVYYTIANFGALIFVTIMTLRQAFAIILSCIIYGHALHPLGFFGIFIVFSTMFTQLYWKANNKGQK
ncbi:Adenosine 3'-phospho 5'-phosphosulfate transporter 1 [Halotydeus destructor]|nr:Adenosine 3'-phospho 5'-phosphosulfate transporter 1 [Halotydeus destructor]